MAVIYFGRNGTPDNNRGQMLRTADKHLGDVEIASTAGGMVLIGCLASNGRRVGVLLDLDEARHTLRRLPSTIADARQARRQGGRA